MKVKIFMPKYMREFKCIGSYCTDTCCAGWDINIDKYTFNKYEKSSGELNLLINGKYIKNNEPQDNFNHGFMVLTDNKNCPFLNENMLCDIHGNVGEKHLCITCKSYPRVFNIVDGVYEKSALPSCIEVCNLAFLNEDKMEFIEDEEEISEEEIELRRIIDTEAFIGSDSLIQYFWDIRVISINIMQSRDFSIDKRLSILKSFYETLLRFYKNDNFEELEELLEEFSENSIDYTAYINTLVKEDARFYEGICSDDLINNIKSERLREYVLEYKSIILKCDDFNNFINDNISYINSFDNYSYIIENYLVNQIFKDLNPFNKGEDITNSVNMLIKIYKTIKAYVIAIAKGSNMDINEELILRVIKSLSKDMEHNKEFKKILEETI